MIRNGISFDDVAEAAEALQAKDENPTIDRVRAFLGGTGSNTTISKYLTMWRSQRPNLQQDGTSLSPPDVVQSVVARVWQQIREETDAEIQIIKSETQKLLDEADQKIENANNETKKITVFCEGLTEQLHALQAMHEIQKLDFKKISEERAVLQERYKGLDERFSDLQRITLKHQEDMALAHKNEICHLVDKSKEQETAAQKLFDELKIHNEDQRIRHAQEIESQKIQNQRLENALNILKEATNTKDLELVKIKTQLNAVTKERDEFSTQILGKWKLVEESRQINNSILSEIKEIPKIDSSLMYFNYYADFKTCFDSSIETLSKNSNEVIFSLEKFEKFLKTNNE